MLLQLAGLPSANEQPRVSSQNVELVSLVIASVLQAGGFECLHLWLTVWEKLSVTEIKSESKPQVLACMARAFMAFFKVRGTKFERMQDFECQLYLLGVSVSQVRSLFGAAKLFPKGDQLANIAVHGAPLNINGFDDTCITAALKYNSINKVREDVWVARVFVCPLALVNAMM
ncbi:MAG: hypothetical protein ABJL67_22820 [Sulfitobacter sp.]